MYLASRMTRKQATFGDTIGYDSTFYFPHPSNSIFAGRWRRSWRAYAMLWSITLLTHSEALDRNVANKTIRDAQPARRAAAGTIEVVDHLPGSWIFYLLPLTVRERCGMRRRQAVDGSTLTGVLLAPAFDIILHRLTGNGAHAGVHSASAASRSKAPS